MPGVMELTSALIALTVGVVIGAILIGGLLVLRRFIWVCRPNEILVFSGRGHTAADGTNLGYRVVHGGYAIQMPFLETVDRLSLETIAIDLRVNNAYSAGGIPLQVQAIANVKVSSDPSIVGNAIERFQGRDPMEIQRVAQESLEGHLRGVLARLTPEQVNEDRLLFAREMVEEAGEDFTKLGLQLDTLKVQSVSDDVEYLDSIGRQRLAEVISEAEVAESNAKADAESEEASASRRGKVAQEQAMTAITEANNQLAEKTAEWEARARGAEERAEQRAIAARALREQRLQELRAKLEQLRLQAERVLPADAERRAEEMRARADAAPIEADGEAMAEVLRMMTKTWASAGDDAAQIFLIQQLEPVLQTIVTRIQQVELGQVVLLDGGQGTALPAHLRALPATVGAILHELSITTGIDVPDLIAPEHISLPDRSNA
ncbi:MAG: flotillin family protein [Deltaproteobacteria bacterium]|nr:MAG: flotillin family protein [Deltaproteobacteria bacterium]